MQRRSGSKRSQKLHAHLINVTLLVPTVSNDLKLISFECWVLCLGERGVLVRMETVGRDGVPARVVTGAAWPLVVGEARGRWQEEIHSTGWSDKQT